MPRWRPPQRWDTATRVGREGGREGSTKIAFLSDTDDLDIELRLARFEKLMDSRPFLLSSVLLRQNPHNVHEWLKRVKLFEGKPREVSPWPSSKT